MKTITAVYWRLYKFFNKYSYYYKGFKKWNLLIYDDIFPNPRSGFRLSEISYLLKKLNNVKIISTNKTYSYIGDNPKNQKKYYIDLLRNNLDFKKQNKISLINVWKLSSLTQLRNINTKLFYCIFLNNIIVLLPYLEKFKIPFVFTLYPGGGFYFGNEESDLILRKVLNSIFFRKVIVNQKFTYNYLIDNSLCTSDKIEFIFGCSVPQNSIDFNPNNKTYYPEKPTLDICFCAGKYTKDGSDKGYPLFIEAMKFISKKYDFTRFHVIGGYDSSTVNVQGYEHKIKFYGYQPFSNLANIYSNADIIVSPNQSNILAKGAFDGFPLGTLVEAAINGLVVITCDPNNENTTLEKDKYHFLPNEEILIINADIKDIILKIENLIENHQLIKKIGVQGSEKFKEIYSDNYQMIKRISVIKGILNQN